MADAAAANQLACSARAVLSAYLRSERPWLKTDAREAFLDATATDLEKLLNEHCHRDSRSRMGFMELSAELRNRIYELVLVDAPEKENGEIRVRKGLAVPALLQVSQQMRGEAAPIFFGSSVFSVSTSSLPADFAELDVLESWLKVIGRKQAGMIENIRIRFGKHYGIETFEVQHYGGEILRICCGSFPRGDASAYLMDIDSSGVPIESWRFKSE